MEDIFEGVQEQTLAAAQNTSERPQDAFSDEPTRRCCHECEECHKYNVPKIVNCVKDLKCLIAEVMECLRDPSSTNSIAILTCIMLSDIQKIENLLENKCFGLKEIKAGIRNIEEQVFNISRCCPDVTSGSVIVEDRQSTHVLVSVKNRNTTVQTVRVRVLRDDVCPAGVLADETLMVSGYCSNTTIVSIKNVAAYEIQVWGLVPGLTVSSVELDCCKCPVRNSRLTASQFICLTGR